MNRDREYEARLVVLIKDSFTAKEMRHQLYVPLSIPYDDVEGTTRSDKATGLVQFCARNGRLPELLNQCQRIRPRIAWPLPSQTEKPSAGKPKTGGTSLKNVPNIFWMLLGAIVVIIIWAGSAWLFDDERTPLPTPTPTATMTATPPATAANTATIAPLSSTRPPTATATPSPIPTVMATATATSTPTATATATMTATPSPTPTRDPHQPPSSPTLGDWWMRSTDEMQLFYVPADTFWMGSLLDTPNANKNEWPQHEVNLSAFWLDGTEVTATQFAIFLNVVGNRREHGVEWINLFHSSSAISEDEGVFFPKPGMDDKPVALVSWYGANAYCQWAGGQLPTEAQWEYAARGPELRTYPWGSASPTCNLAQFRVCPDGVQAVGNESPEGDSWVGATDMGGNVWEWTADWYGEYETAVLTNPTGPLIGSTRVLRGGSWGGESWMTRTAYRYEAIPTYRSVFQGFRCVVPYLLHGHDQ